MTRKAQQPASLGALAKRLGFSRTAVAGWAELDGAPIGFDVREWKKFVRAEGLGVGGNRVPREREVLLRAKLTEEIALLRARRAREEAASIPIAEFHSLLLTLGTRQKSILFSRLGTDLPVTLAGLDAGQIRSKLIAVGDEICTEMQTLAATYETKDSPDAKGS